MATEKKVFNYKRTITSPVFCYLKKHRCPRCGGELEIVTKSKVVHPKSPEAKDFDFSHGDTYFFGAAEFAWDEFLCAKCKLQATVCEIQYVEQIRKIIRQRRIIEMKRSKMRIWVFIKRIKITTRRIINVWDEWKRILFIMFEYGDVETKIWLAMMFESAGRATNKTRGYLEKMYFDDYKIFSEIEQWQRATGLIMKAPLKK